MRARRILRSVGKNRETDWRFTIVLCFIYFAYLVWMHVHHEMWRDEVHPWTLARLAHGFWDLVTGDRVYEGHPPGWFWYLRVWTWFVKATWGIQVATLTAAVAAAVLFVRLAPFPRYLKVLTLFSFYFAFEYTVMSRNYVLGWLSVCLFCALYHPLYVRYFGLALALALMSLTSVFGLIMSIFLLGFVILEQVRLSFFSNRLSPPTRFTLASSPWLLATVVFVSGVILFCVLTLEPPDPNPFSPGFCYWALNLQALPDMLYRLTAGFLPWRGFSPGALFTMQAISEVRTLWVNEFLGVVVLVLALLSLYPSWRLILVYLGAIATMEVFGTIRFDGSTRHWGHYVMLLLAACWLLRTTFPRRKHWISTVFLSAVFAFQLEAAVVAIVVDTKEVFSGGRETAAFIVRQGLQDLPIVAGPDYAADTVAGYLRRPFIAHETEEINQTVVFHGRRKHFSTEELVKRSVAVAHERRSPVLLICTQPLPDPPAGTTRTLLFTSHQGVVADETFSVYRVQAP
jgi:hypothetical protein